MATVINNPSSNDSSGGVMGMIILVVVLMLAGYVLYVYGLPAVRQEEVGTPQINIPSEVDVNINKTE